MNERGRFVAALLDSVSKAMAAGAAIDLQERLGTEAVPGSFEELVSEVEQRVHHLGAALAVGIPALYAREVAWTRTTFAARGVAPEFLRESLVSLRTAVEERLPPGHLELVREYLSAGEAVLEEPEREVGTCLAEGEHVELARRFLLAVLEGKRASATELLFAARVEGIPVGAIRKHVLERVQDEIGRMWQKGEIFEAEEHFCSRVVEEALALLREPRADENQKTVVVLTVAGDLHDIGGRMVADQFEARGWRVIFLGANVPVDATARAVKDFGVDLVALSVTQGVNLRAAAAQIEGLRAANEKHVPVMVGGAPFRDVPDLWRAIGADGCANDPESAVATAESLVAV